MKKLAALLVALSLSVCATAVTAMAADANPIDTEWNYCDITNFFDADNENTVLTVVYDNSAASDPAGMNIGFKLEHTEWGTAVWPYFAADGSTGEITFTITRDELLAAGKEANGGVDLGTMMWAQVENGSSGAKLVSVAYSAPVADAPADDTADAPAEDAATDAPANTGVAPIAALGLLTLGGAAMVATKKR